MTKMEKAVTIVASIALVPLIILLLLEMGATTSYAIGGGNTGSCYGDDCDVDWTKRNLYGEYLNLVKEEESTSCDGIDRFVRDDFVGDLESMSKTYKRIYMSEEYPEPQTIQPPSGMILNNSFDCEDYAHAVRCLGDEYNITCNFWYGTQIGPIVPKDKSSHLGVCCLVDGEWICDE